jgi:hypothetical protein
MSHALLSALIVASILLATWMLLCVVMHATRAIHRGHVAVSIALAVVGVAVWSYVTIIIVFGSPKLGQLLIAAGWLLVAVYFFRMKAWRVPREATVAFILTAAILFINLGLLYLWKFDGSFWTLAQGRFVSGGLPSDNTLAAQFAEHIGLGKSTHPLAGDWNGSDRPPLQAGFILLFAGPAILIGQSATGAAAASVVAQMLWVPATFAFLRALGVSLRATMIAITFAALTSTIIVNSVFTWPKLLAAAMVLSALALLAAVGRADLRPRALFVGAVVASTLGLLAHGGTAFALPTVIVFAVWRLRKSGLRALARHAAWGAAALAVLYTPWLLFQRFVDPPGDRLLKWHLAGVIPITDQSFFAVLGHAYSSLTFGQIVSNKWANFREVFDVNLLRGVYPWSGESRGARNNAEFLFTSNALSLAVVIIVAMAVYALVVRARGKRIGSTDRRLGLACVATLPSLLAWVLIMFGPASTVVHQGSHVWIVILLTVPVAWLALRSDRAGWVVVALQGGLALYFLAPSWAPSPLRPWGLATLVAGLLLLGGAHVLARVGGEPPEPREVP